MAELIAGPAGLDMSNIQLGALLNATIVASDPSQIVYDLHDGQMVTLTGSDLALGSGDALTAGLITGVSASLSGQLIYSLSEFSVAATTVQGWINSNAYDAALGTILGGPDTIVASDTGNVLTGYGGADSVVGGAGNDFIQGVGPNATVLGGAGDDIIWGVGYLRGGDGADTIVGISGSAPGHSGATFDNINGNAGNDSIVGGGGADWLLGGQGDDTIRAGAPGQIINGNLGNDVIILGTPDETDSGPYTVHGGQGNDLLDASNTVGDVHLYGDRGDDTILAGWGVDTIHFGPGGGHDIVIGFKTDVSVAHVHDWIELDGVTSYTVTQAGPDIVIDIGGGDQLTIKNLSALPSAWIIQA